MSKDWTPEELQAASKAMKDAGHLSYEEFCDRLDGDMFIPIIREDEEGKEKQTE